MSHQPDEHPRPEETPPNDASTGGLAGRREALERIQVALRGLRYGTVTAVVHDGVVVQVERTEKIRLEGRSRREPSS